MRLSSTDLDFTLLLCSDEALTFVWDVLGQFSLIAIVNLSKLLGGHEVIQPISILRGSEPGHTTTYPISTFTVLGTDNGVFVT